VTGIIRTIKQAMVVGRIGALETGELRIVENALREILTL
jgi:hypothetical protein